MIIEKTQKIIFYRKIKKSLNKRKSIILSKIGMNVNFKVKRTPKFDLNNLLDFDDQSLINISKYQSVNVKQMQINWSLIEIEHFFVTSIFCSPSYLFSFDCFFLFLKMVSTNTFSFFFAFNLHFQFNFYLKCFFFFLVYFFKKKEEREREQFCLSLSVQNRKYNRQTLFSSHI